MGYGNYEFGRDMGAIRGHQAAQASSLRNLEFAAGANLVFSGLTALNTAKQARLMEEQHALQQVMAEQTARHEFSMWRQTPDGIAFVDWQRRAAVLIPLLRERDRAWHHAWAQAIDRARASTPADERARLASRSAQLKQAGLGLAALALLAVGGFGLVSLVGVVAGAGAQLLGLAALIAGLIIWCRSQAPETRIHWGWALGAVAAAFVVGSMLPPLVLIALGLVGTGAGVAVAVLRSRRAAAVRLDPTVANEARDRIERWGFDPLTVRAPWYPWYASNAFAGYADRLEHLAIQGATLRPSRTELIPLQLPAAWPPSNRLPAEVDALLAAFQQENDALAR